MSEPLTTEHFDDTMRSIADTLGEHGTILNGHTQQLDKIDERLKSVESTLWQGQRLDEVERRVIKLAELSGAADLATPFNRPVGS